MRDPIRSTHARDRDWTIAGCAIFVALIVFAVKGDP